MEISLLLGFAWRLLLILSQSLKANGRDEIQVLMEIKAALDPHGQILHSWQKAKSPCNGAFLGVSCNDAGEISNLSLQGHGLSGSIPAVVAELASLTGLYLHYNNLEGQIPGTALARIKGLTEVYLNVNNLSGTIPPELASIPTLQVLQLCCNGLSGRIPEELGQLSQLRILELDHNSLSDSIPSTFGSLTSLTHLGLSFNKLTGPIPSSICGIMLLTVFDVRNNYLSGSTPEGLHRLEDGFTYTNNSLLCGNSFLGMPTCATGTSQPVQRPQPFGGIAPALSAPYLSSVHGKSKSHQVNKQFKHTPNITEIAIIGGVIAMTFGVVIAATLSFVWFRRHKQRISSTYEAADQKGCKKNIPKSSFESGMYKCEKSPVQKAIVPKSTMPVKSPGSAPRKTLNNYNYKLEDIELATNFFSNNSLLGKNAHAATFKAILRDGSVVVKNLSKTSFTDGETQFEEALEMLSHLNHENLLNVKGFCCSGGGRQCYLVYDFIPNGTLYGHLHGSTDSLLDWPSRVHIALGIAKGLDYLHTGFKETVIQHMVWASNIFLDDNYNAMISDCGLSRIVPDEVVYANIKRSASMGYLAPEYGFVGYLNAKSDIFAFGVLLLELLTGCLPPDIRDLHGNHNGNWVNALLDAENLHKFVDPSLRGKYPVAGIMGLASIAFSCTAEAPHERPVMALVVQLLSEIESLMDVPPDGGCSSSGEEYPAQQAEYARMLDYGR